MKNPIKRKRPRLQLLFAIGYAMHRVDAKLQKTTLKGDKIVGQIILDVNEVTQKDSVLMIKGYDIDQLIGLMDEQAEVEPSCIAFDLEKQGNRIYLYKTLKSICKDGRIDPQAFVGKVVRFSTNFLVKPEE